MVHGREPWPGLTIALSSLTYERDVPFAIKDIKAQPWRVKLSALADLAKWAPADGHCAAHAGTESNAN